MEIDERAAGHAAHAAEWGEWIDLYARDAKGQWRWAAATRPSQQEMQAALLRGIAPGMREYAVYLPLYNGTESLSIGVPAGAKFEGLAPRKAKPIVFYGTSITHGACASRPGITHPAILGRWLDRPVINIGFSGNGRMHEAVGKLMAEVDAACYVIDCLPNMNAAAERCVPLVKLLRKARPDTPIVLVEDRRFANSWLTPDKAKFHDDNHAALRKAHEQLKAGGVKHLHYLGGDVLLGDDTEGTTDASHPNDLGFLRQADAFEPVLRKALGLNMMINRIYGLFSRSLIGPACCSRSRRRFGGRILFLFWRTISAGRSWGVTGTHLTRRQIWIGWRRRACGLRMRMRRRRCARRIVRRCLRGSIRRAWASRIISAPIPPTACR